MLESEELETTSCRSRSSSSEVHALQLFFRLVAISSGHAHFRALEAAGLSFRSALPAHLQQHFLLSGCGLCLRCCVSEHPLGRQRFHPSAVPSQQSACRYASAPSSSTCCARPPRHNRRNPPSIYAHPMRQLFPKLRLCPIVKASCFSLRPARARPAVRRRGPLPLPLRPLRLHQDLGAASCCP